jgi:hypothetical protein
MAKGSEHEIRKEAIDRFVRGESPKQIYTELGRSKPWFFKWVKRYRSGDPHWFEDLSSSPTHQRNRIPEELERQIVQIRTELQNTKYAQIGANAINWQLQRKKLAPVAVATINRVIKRHDLTKKRKKYQPKNTSYPVWPCLAPNSVHQADLVGPRFIKNDGRFYCLNVMDIYTHRVKLNPCRTKEDHRVADGLIESWKCLGMPDFLQVDNELSFRGSNRYPHSFGIVIRLCLSLGIQPVFIPMGEPWRNAQIESFQNLFDKAFYRSQRFPSYKVLCQEAKIFEEFHNENHVYSFLKGRTPNGSAADTQLEKLPKGFKLRRSIPIEPGCVHLIRFIRSDRRLDIFGEKFLVHKDLVYEYVVATICTEIHQLQVRHDGQLIQCFDYHIPIPFKAG